MKISFGHLLLLMHDTVDNSRYRFKILHFTMRSTIAGYQRVIASGQLSFSAAGLRFQFDIFLRVVLDLREEQLDFESAYRLFRKSAVFFLQH